MKKMAILASVLVATLSSSAIAQAACTQAHMNNKSWKLTAQDAHGTLIFCSFRASGAGTIAGNPTGCEYHTVGADADFGSRGTLAIFDGSIAMVPDDKCTYALTMTLDVTGDSTLKALLVLESGKTIANGNFLLSSSDGGGRAIGGGPISMMRQASR